MIITYWKGLFIADRPDTLDLGVKLSHTGWLEHRPGFCEQHCKACQVKAGLRYYTDSFEYAAPFSRFFNEAAKEFSRKKTLLIEKSRAVSSDIFIPCPDGLEYLGYQKAGIEYAAQRKDTLIADSMGLGKLHRSNTKIITPDRRWVEIGSLKVGDSVIGSNGKATKIVGVFPQGIKDSFRVLFSDHSSVEAGAEHLWAIDYKVGGRRIGRIILKTEQLRLRPIIEMTWDDRQNTKLDLSKTPLKIPSISGPVIFEKGPSLPLPAYLIGQLIANGHIAEQGSTPQLTCHAEDAVHIHERIISLGIKISPQKTYGKAARILIPGIVNICRELGLNRLSAKKRIPEVCFTASPDDRMALLQGLMDGDGSITSEKCRVVYHSICKELAQDVVSLVEELGGVASIRTYDRSAENKPVEYQVRIRTPAWAPPFSTPRKAGRYKPGSHSLPLRTVVSVEKTGSYDSVCIAVEAEDRLYVTEHCIVTHNTVQALGFVNKIKPKNVLVVCPKSIKYNWLEEAQKWLVDEWRFHVVENNDAPKKDVNFVIINYEKLVKDNALTRWLSQIWDVLVCDEAHLLKTPTSQRTQAILGVAGLCLMRRARRTLFLTGTPIMNAPRELWPIVSAISPVQFGNWAKFMARYCQPRVDQTGRMRYDGGTNLEELQTRLRTTCMVRRLKDEVLKDLPPKIRQLVYLDDGKGEVDPAIERWNLMYREKVQKAEAKAEAARSENDFKEAVKEMDVVVGIAFTEMSKYRHDTAVRKLPHAIEYIDNYLEETGAKIIVFAHHKDVLGPLLEHYGQIAVAVWGDGKTSDLERQAKVRAFQENPEIRVFIGGLKAAGVGITLTAAEAVIFVEGDWTPATMMQAEDRAHRIGQSRPVHVIQLVLKDTLDANMAKFVQRKMVLAEKTLDRRLKVENG